MVAAEEDAIVDATAARELLCGTGVGDGVREPTDETVDPPTSNERKERDKSKSR